MTRRLPAALVLPLPLALLAACSSSGPPGGGSNSASGSSGGHTTITVFAAASLTGTFTELGTAFTAAHPGTDVKFSFAGSSDLATQINEGAPADVFASAAPGNMDTVAKQGNTVSVVTFAQNQAEIAVPADNPAHVAGLSDLAKSGVKVALCQPQVPCGKVAAQVFANAKLTVRATTEEKDVKTTLAKVTAGEVDAGIVYVTDVKAAGTKVKGLEIPMDVNATTSYPISALKHSKNAAAAQAFVEFVRSSPAQKVLTAAGFLRP